ncbi:acetolactate synthase 2 small subunit [Bowmanella dokdonensis]|uniref:Acetolactate synthase 2 small subunit n=1 Tax=Bowmanella dokdonensis TaxID=751969 RepID=A0A939DPZ6_9ALTE|nr:acetolactate synthase 2 small subunit [Bowmanella dokdonensis]MBN7825806.1 acetolactate synthase 2 small subunit [Bowmanella dokdonensis]
MNYQIDLLLADQPAVLERVLQTTRYRGFRINQLNMQPTASQLKVSMQVYGKQPINILTTQLHKLYDLASLECQAQQNSTLGRRSLAAQTLPKTA